MATEIALSLENNNWLNSLPTKVKAQLISAVKIKHMPAQQRVHSKDEQAEGLYCLLAGELKVCINTAQGAEFVFTRIQPGNWFGEIAILDGGGRTHDGVTVVDSVIAMIPQHTIRTLCEQNIELYKALVTLLCNHCRFAFNAIDEMLKSTNEQRLATLIATSVAEHPSAVIRISQEELGAQIGISRQSINKILKSWQNHGWINRIYGGIEVIDVDKLTKISTSNHS